MTSDQSLKGLESLSRRAAAYLDTGEYRVLPLSFKLTQREADVLRVITQGRDMSMVIRTAIKTYIETRHHGGMAVDVSDEIESWGCFPNDHVPEDTLRNVAFTIRVSQENLKTIDAYRGDSSRSALVRRSIGLLVAETLEATAQEAIHGESSES